MIKKLTALLLITGAALAQEPEENVAMFVYNPQWGTSCRMMTTDYAVAVLRMQEEKPEWFVAKYSLAGNNGCPQCHPEPNE